MSNQTLALALCRVSSDEQLLNNSLSRQREAVLKAAVGLGVTIPDDCWWSGSVSSKRGTNLNRKDLKEMLDRCKKDKRVKYLIVDEPDRFMRSIDEAAYFEVTFRQLGVTVWYASNPELNKGDLSAKLIKFTKYLAAEGSNEERQHKAIVGQTKLILEGRYPFAPKPGYRRGHERAVYEIHPVRGPALRKVLLRLAGGLVTPSQALVELNNSDFMKGHAFYRMDKFRNIVIDPYYAGIIEVNKQIKMRNENGLHEPLIAREQHLELVRIMTGKTKNQLGPRKNGNPKYPCNNIVACSRCVDKKNGRFVGFDHGNGKPNSKVYEKYRCRSCGLYLTRQELHQEIEKQFRKYAMTDEARRDVLEALNAAWQKEDANTANEIRRIEERINQLENLKNNQVESALDPANMSIKDEILAAIQRKKDEISNLNEQLYELQQNADNDKQRFLSFAYDFIENMGRNFLDISPENRLRCKQLVFPGGFYLDKNNKVYTPEISPLITLATIKKDAEASEFTQLVRVTGL